MDKDEQTDENQCIFDSYDESDNPVDNSTPEGLHPENQLRLKATPVYEGEDAEFIYKVQQEDLEEIWYVNDIEASGERHEIKSRGLVRSLILKNTTVSDNGTKVTVKIGDEEISVHLEVEGSSWAKQLKDVSVYEGGTARFSCEVRNNSSDVIWYVNDNVVSHGDLYDVIADGCTRQLLIKGAKLSDNDMNVTAKVGEQVTSAKVLVKRSQFITQISDVMVAEGDTAVFCCEVRNVTDTVQWFVNGNSISSNDRFTETKDGTRRELRIHNCTLADNETRVFVDINEEEREALLSVKDQRENQGRWLTVGVALNSVLCPLLRKYVHHEMKVFYLAIESSNAISRQSCPPTFQHYLGKTLNYQAINGNEAQGKQFIRNTYNNRYDFTVKTPLNLAKLFLPSHMSHLTGFDHTCDISAALNIIIGAGLSVNKEADQVKQEVRNLWSYCNLNEWGPKKFTTSFSLINDLVKRLSLSSKEEGERLKELEKMKDLGPYLLDGTCGITLVQNEIKQFMKDVKDLKESTNNEVIKKTIQDSLDSVYMRVDSLEEKMEKVEKIVNDHIPANIREQIRRIVDEWITDDNMYVPTKAAEQVMKTIKEHNFVVATGNSGTGKTYTVRHTALMMEKAGYVIVPAVNPEDISKYYKHGCKTVFVFDDLCGRFTLNQNFLDQWEACKQTLSILLKNEDCKIIASCRLQVYNADRMKSFISDIGVNECRINSSVKEKTAMIIKYFGQKEMAISDDLLSKLDFFPFLCLNFKNKHISELKKCIENPFDFFNGECEKLFLVNNEGKRKCCGLILCVLYNNTLTSNEFSNKGKREVFQSVLEECELSSSESPKRIKTSLESLVGVYITNDDGKYTIIHDKLFDVIAKYFGQKMTSLFIEFSDPDFFRERFLVNSRRTSGTTDLIEISYDKIKLFMERMVCDWKKGIFKIVLSNINMLKENFRKSFLSYLKERDELSQIELVQKQDTNRNTPLHCVCILGDLEFARWMLDLGADVNHKGYGNFIPFHNRFIKLLKLLENSKNEDTVIEFLRFQNDTQKRYGRYHKGLTPLMIACNFNHLEVVKLLLKCEKIDADQSDEHGYTALHLACEKGNVEIVTALLQRIIDINKTTSKACYSPGYTPLMLACDNNHLEVVLVLLACEQIDVNLCAVDGTTALQLACKKGNVKTVTDLLQTNLDINRSDKNGRSPLLIACLCNHLKVVKVLLACEQIDVNLCAADGTTALQLACKEGNVKIITELLQKNVDINRSDKNGRSPLLIACLCNHLKVVKVLLACEQIDVDHCDNSGITSLHLSCASGNAEIVTELMQSNADINAPTKNGVTPLMIAVCKNHIEVVKVLLACEQIDVDLCAVDGTTVLQLACYKGNVKIINELLQKNVDINRSDKNGRTPLIIACLYNHLKVVKVLLTYEQIDVDHCDNNGSTALHLSCASGNAEIVTELIQSNAGINAPTNGMTPLIIALRDNHIEVVKVLLACEKIDVELSDVGGTTALHLACYKGNLKMITDLLQRNVDINRSDKEGNTSLILACNNSHLEVVKVLLTCEHIDINHSANDGTTALFSACLKGNIDIVKLLIEHKVDINKAGTENRPKILEDCTTHYTDSFKEYLNSQSTDQKEKFQKLPGIWTCQTIHTNVIRDMAKFTRYDFYTCKNVGNLPLMAACWQNNIDVVKELLKCPNIEINRCNIFDRSALYWACIQGHVAIIALLLEHRADVNLSDVIGISPLHIACWARNKEAIRLLIEHGADKTLQDKGGKTPVDVAVEENDEECLSILNRSLSAS